MMKLLKFIQLVFFRGAGAKINLKATKGMNDTSYALQLFLNFERSVKNEKIK